MLVLGSAFDLHWSVTSLQPLQKLGSGTTESTVNPVICVVGFGVSGLVHAPLAQPSGQLVSVDAYEQTKWLHVPWEA
jgi:hypothetical protein